MKVGLPCLYFIFTADQQCDLPSNEAGIIWDSICFAFLLLQRRVFMSYYFLHVVADIRASQILASRWTVSLFPNEWMAVKSRMIHNLKYLVCLYLMPFHCILGGRSFSRRLSWRRWGPGWRRSVNLWSSWKDSETSSDSWRTLIVLVLVCDHFSVQPSDPRWQNGTVGKCMRVFVHVDE